MNSPHSRIVVKLGTQVVVNQENGTIALERVVGVVDDIAKLRRQGVEVILVSSGAVGLGRQALSLAGPLELSQKQACAAVGQSRLMGLYSELFAVHGITVGQVLVTAQDFANRAAYLNLRTSFECLLEMGVVPIVNENDVVSVAGIKPRGEVVSDEAAQQRGFDDNDKLSSLVAAKLSADTLIILTNVDGVFTDNPASNPDAQRVSRITALSELRRVDCRGQSALGRGGMASKLEAAKIAGLCGVKTIISSANRPLPVVTALGGEVGTLVDLSAVLAREGALSGRERWIGVASGFAGLVTVDKKAQEKLQEGRSSLLPVGVTAVVGEFAAGSVISIVDTEGQEIGRGLAGQSSQTLRSTAGKRSSAVASLLSDGEREEVVHRDDLVLFGGEDDAE